MMRKVPLRWKILVAFLIACGLGSLLAWGILLTSFCSHSRIPLPGADIAYNCHGATVFISHFESAMHDWLIPIGGLFIFLSLVAGVGAFIASGHVKIQLSVNITDTSKSDGRK